MNPNVTKTLVAPILFLLWSVPASAEPVKLANSARFDLSAGAGVGKLDDGQVVAGNGSIQRPNWVPESQQSAAYTVNFPVTRLGWRESAIRFTPTGSGAVTLTLMGPWEEASQGVVYRQEVLWDVFEVDGATLANGSFESPTSGWQSAGGSIVGQTSDAPAVAGTNYARTWHCAKKLGEGESSQNVKPFIGTLRVTNPVRQSRASSRQRVLRGGG